MIEVVGGILVRDGHLLLGLRAPHKSYPGCWDVFGGHLEVGESPWDALRRELAEELGVTVTAGAPLEGFGFDNSSEGPSFLHLFRVDAWRGEPRLADDEHLELRWFAPEAAQALFNLPSPEYRPLFASLGLAAGS
jgi:8-oxo-dGTP pyrophosphatase MutT (NUDIX family)